LFFFTAKSKLSGETVKTKPKKTNFYDAAGSLHGACKNDKYPYDTNTLGRGCLKIVKFEGRLMALVRPNPDPFLERGDETR
jgi:hypothetical protein